MALRDRVYLYSTSGQSHIISQQNSAQIVMNSSEFAAILAQFCNISVAAVHPSVWILPNRCRSVTMCTPLKLIGPPRPLKPAFHLQ